MADKKKLNDDDEYHFDDMDAFNLETGAEPTSSTHTTQEAMTNDYYEPGLEPTEDPLRTEETITKTTFIESNTVVRNSLIVLGGLFALFIFYEVYTYFYGDTDNIAKTKVVAIKPVQPITAPPPSVPVLPPSPAPSEVSQELSRVEQGQQTVSSQVTTMNSQMQGMTSNVQLMANKVGELTQAVTQLNLRLEEQAKVMEELLVRTHPRPSTKKVKVVVDQLTPKLYIQAVIPGRAWLIAIPTGETLTVREGTPIKGYGIVKLIDPIQGRVMTSSGRIIRFSKEDS